MKYGSFDEMVRGVWKVDAAWTAVEIEKLLALSDEQRRLLHQPIMSAVSKVDRAEKRATERRAFQAEPTIEDAERAVRRERERVPVGVWRSGPGPTEVLERLTSERQDALDKMMLGGFALGDGRYVTWEDATVDDHKRRIVFLEKGMSGTRRTIRQHQATIELLNEAGADRLADLEAEDRQRISETVEAISEDEDGEK